MEIINGLWLGRELGILEELTLKSFTSFGYEFHLWHYEPVMGIDLPSGVVLRDGNEILPSSRIFRYPKMILNFGEGSYVGFSEIFRYKLLYELGGWWSDLDVTCLKPIDIAEDYFFRNHGVLSVVGNIIKVPPKSELMGYCLEKAEKEVNEHQNDWHHAIRILCYYIEFLGLSHCIHTDACNLDRLEMLREFVHETNSLDIIPPTWKFIHWCNSVINRDYKQNSVFEQLCFHFQCKKVKKRFLFI